ncbi:MAG: hypothetical protein Alpg2KO_03880 [Alphaproteobacteria bacterium]
MDADEWDESLFDDFYTEQDEDDAPDSPEDDADSIESIAPQSDEIPDADDTPTPPAPAVKNSDPNDPGAGWLTAQAYEASAERWRMDRPPPADISVPKVKPAKSAPVGDTGDTLATSLRLALGTGMVKPPSSRPEAPEAPQAVRPKRKVKTRKRPEAPTFNTEGDDQPAESAESPSQAQEETETEAVSDAAPVEAAEAQADIAPDLPDPRFINLDAPLTPRPSDARRQSGFAIVLGKMVSAGKLTIALAAGVYVVMCAALFLLQRDLQYPGTSLPPVEPPAFLRGLQVPEPVLIKTDDGLELTSWLVPPREGAPVILLAHGNGQTAESWFSRAREWQEKRGWGMMIIGYRGYGGNPGGPSEEDLIADARLNRDWLARRYPRNPMLLYGQSLGSGVMTAIASDPIPRKPQALVLEAPYTSMTDVARQFFGWLPVGLLLLDQYETIDRIDQVQIPLVVLHGTRDLTIPYAQGQTLVNTAVNASSRHMVTVQGGGHSDLYTPRYQADIGKMFELIEALISKDQQRR